MVGGISVYYEIVPNSIYLQLGYSGPLFSIKSDMEIARDLCSLINVI